MQNVPGDHPYERIYLVVYEGAAPAGFAHQMSRATSDALGAHTGARQARVLTGLEFDTRFVAPEIDRFGGQAILSIRPIGSRPGRHGEFALALDHLIP